FDDDTADIGGSRRVGAHADKQRLFLVEPVLDDLHKLLRFSAEFPGAHRAARRNVDDYSAVDHALDEFPNRSRSLVPKSLRQVDVAYARLARLVHFEREAF